MSENTLKVLRPMWLVLGLVSVALGVLGIVLPVLPTYTSDDPGRVLLFQKLAKA